MNSGFISGNEAEWIELIEWLEFNWINARNETYSANWAAKSNLINES